MVEAMVELLELIVRAYIVVDEGVRKTLLIAVDAEPHLAARWECIVYAGDIVCKTLV